jgi:hypothetical protein
MGNSPLPPQVCFPLSSQHVRVAPGMPQIPPPFAPEPPLPNDPPIPPMPPPVDEPPAKVVAEPWPELPKMLVSPLPPQLAAATNHAGNMIAFRIVPPGLSPPDTLATFKRNRMPKRLDKGICGRQTSNTTP